MEKVYDLKLTPQELEAVLELASKALDKAKAGTEAEIIMGAVKDKTGLLLHVVEAVEDVHKLTDNYNTQMQNAKLARTAAWNAYNNAVKGVHIDADGVARDADGIPVLPFE